MKCVTGRVCLGEPRQSGGIGRHATFRALCAYARGGSSPPFGTHEGASSPFLASRKGRIVGLVRRFAKPLSGLLPTVGSNPTPSATEPDEWRHQAQVTMGNDLGFSLCISVFEAF